MNLTREALSDYINIEHEINRINKKLEYYSKKPIATKHGIVKGSMHSYPYAEAHFVVSSPDIKNSSEREQKVSGLLIELAEKKVAYEKIQFEIDLEIEKIPDMEMRNIIQMKFVDRMTDEEIADILGYERSTIAKKVDRFLGKNVSQISH